jgi:hypothetical protein
MGKGIAEDNAIATLIRCRALHPYTYVVHIYLVFF